MTHEQAWHPTADEITARREEIQGKLTRVRALLEHAGYDALRLTTVASTTWITAGTTTYVDDSSEHALCNVLVTRDAAFVVSDVIEEPHLRDEEHVEELGFTLVIEPWQERGRWLAALAERTRVLDEDAMTTSGASEADRSIASELLTLRQRLVPTEQQRMRTCGQLAAGAMAEAITAVRPGMTEDEAAAQLAAASRRRGGSPIVVLVGSDARIYRYRHPVPTARPIERYAMLILCLRWRGLVAAITRSVHFGPLPEDLARTAQAVARVDAAMIAGTRAGATLRDVYALARQAYAEVGHPAAIDEHHQGGLIGYRSREELATTETATELAPGCALAWNPSIRGAKSEDTVLLGPEGTEILTAIASWPVWEIEVAGRRIPRPSIAER